MFRGLKGKRLLYLGGIKRAAYVVERARELGIYVVVADYNEDSPAKLVANEGLLVDATDVEAITEVCLKHNIDGILTGYADILLPICKEVAENVGIPFYATEEMLEAATNKAYFKEMCEKYNVPVPRSYDQNVLQRYEELEYPVFIKPHDASGSRGADVCMNSNEFLKKYEYALSYSKKKTVAVEEFLFGTEFILDYLLIDGEPRLLSMADRYTISGRGAAINSCNLMILPSKYLNQYSTDIDLRVKEMFTSMNFKDGLIFLQGYANDNKIAFYEMGCRLGGTWPYVDEYFMGLNPMDALFSHSLTGKMLPVDCSVDISPFFKGKAAIIYFLSNRPEGKIHKIHGVEKLKEYSWVVNVMQFYDEGDSFDMERQTDVRFLSVHLVANDFDELKKRVSEIYSIIDFCDETGESLLMQVYDINTIEGYEQ